MWKRKVTAGAYVTVAITIVAFITPGRWLDTFPGLRVVGGLIVALCVVGAVYEWWWRPADASEPDVRLEMPTSGTFLLRNAGAAADSVSVSDIVVPDRYIVEFPPVFDLHDTSAIQPAVRSIGLTAAMNQQRPDNKSMTIMDFFDRMARDKAIYIQEVRSDGVHSDSITTGELLTKGMTPLRFQLTVTVKVGKQSWTRRETLRYDSSRGVAWIDHTGGN
jgi:hypothetical protein